MSTAVGIIPAGSGDIAVTRTPDPLAPGRSMVELQLAPNRDIGLVTGMLRIRQDVILRLSIPTGTSPFFPTLGNNIFQQVGRPYSDPGEMTDAIANVETQLLAEHLQDAQDGQRQADAVLVSLRANTPTQRGTDVNIVTTVTAADTTTSLLSSAGN